MSKALIKVSGLSKRYEIGARQQPYRTIRESFTSMVTAPFQSRERKKSLKAASEEERTIWALEDVSFEIGAGEVVGVIGRNGAGKSTLLKILSRITEPTTGEAHIRGRIGSLLEVGTGFHGELTGRENIFLNGAILGMKRADILRQFDRIVAFAEVEKFIDTPVKHYSTGMYLRLAFAVAAHLDPEILLVDEVLAVGDAAFQRKCIGRIGEVAEDGRTVLFVSHNMGAIRSLCQKGLVLDNGKVAYSGDIGKSIESYFRMTNAAPVPEAGTSRNGFGPVSLADGRSSIEQREGFEVSTTLKVPEESAGFTLICLLEDASQRTMFHQRIDSSEFRLGKLVSDPVAIRLKLPPLWLEPGMYSLYFKALVWGQQGQSRIVSDIFHLDVGGTSSGWNSILSPTAQWSVDPVRETASVSSR
jgi:lipopolysaccharide transport system ATP-binding protein